MYLIPLIINNKQQLKVLKIQSAVSTDNSCHKWGYVCNCNRETVVII